MLQVPQVPPESGEPAPPLPAIPLRAQALDSSAAPPTRPFASACVSRKFSSSRAHAKNYNAHYNVIYYMMLHYIILYHIKLYYFPFITSLLCARHCANCFAYVAPFGPQRQSDGCSVVLCPSAVRKLKAQRGQSISPGS